MFSSLVDDLAFEPVSAEDREDEAVVVGLSLQAFVFFNFDKLNPSLRLNRGLESSRVHVESDLAISGLCCDIMTDGESKDYAARSGCWKRRMPGDRSMLYWKAVA